MWLSASPSSALIGIIFVSLFPTSLLFYRPYQCIRFSHLLDSGSLGCFTRRSRTGWLSEFLTCGQALFGYRDYRDKPFTSPFLCLVVLLCYRSRCLNACISEVRAIGPRIVPFVVVAQHQLCSLGLAADATTADVEKLFENYGRMAECRVMTGTSLPNPYLSP